MFKRIGYGNRCQSARLGAERLKRSGGKMAGFCDFQIFEPKYRASGFPNQIIGKSKPLYGPARNYRNQAGHVAPMVNDSGLNLDGGT